MITKTTLKTKIIYVVIIIDKINTQENYRVDLDQRLQGHSIVSRDH